MKLDKRRSPERGENTAEWKLLICSQYWIHFIFMPTQNHIGITKCDAIFMLSDTDEIESVGDCFFIYSQLLSKVVHDDSNNGHAGFPLFCITNAVNWTYVGAKKENLEKIIHSHVCRRHFTLRCPQHFRCLIVCVNVLECVLPTCVLHLHGGRIFTHTFKTHSYI